MLLNITWANSTSSFAMNCCNFPTLYPARVKELHSWPQNGCQPSHLEMPAHIKEQEALCDCPPSLGSGLGKIMHATLQWGKVNFLFGWLLSLQHFTNIHWRLNFIDTSKTHQTYTSRGLNWKNEQTHTVKINKQTLLEKGSKKNQFRNRPFSTHEKKRRKNKSEKSTAWEQAFHSAEALSATGRAPPGFGNITLPIFCFFPLSSSLHHIRLFLLIPYKVQETAHTYLYCLPLDHYWV